MGEISRALSAPSTDSGGDQCDTSAAAANGVTKCPPSSTSCVYGRQHPFPQVATLEDPRVMRIKVLDSIVTCLEKKKPGWQKARILHLSTQLEESLFLSKESMAEYGDPSTLPSRINRHCLLLATRKTANPPVTPNTTVSAHGSTPFSFEPAPPAVMHTAQPREGGNNTDGFLAGSERRGGGPRLGGATVDMEADIWQEGCRFDGGKEALGSNRGGDSSENASSTMSPPAPIVRLPSSESEAVAFPSYDHQQDDSADRALKDKQTYSLNSLAATTAAVVGDRGTGGEIGVAGDETWCASGGENPRISAATEGGDRAETVPKERKRVLAATGSCGVGAEAEAAEGCAEIVDVDAGDRHGSGDKRRHPAHDKEVRQHALRLLQSRLLLLSHASECCEENGGCTLSPLCDSVRQLLEHLKACEAKAACSYPHCDSSKAILHHQRLCHDAGCMLCGSARDLAQKCFWANARHAHKRRLQESHEMRRKKRQSEGKTVAAPRKQTEKPKTGRETCSGLDEAGNDLGDISLGFFLRQDKAVKARKMSHENATSQAGTVPSPNTTEGGDAPMSHIELQHHQPRSQVKELRDATAAVNASSSPASSPRADTPITTNPGVISGVIRGFGSAKKQDKTRGDWTNTNTNTANITVANRPFAQPVSPRVPRFALPGVFNEDRDGFRDKEVDLSGRDLSGGGSEARAVIASSGGGRGPAARGGGLTVVIPASGVMAGHLRSPSEVMLDEIAESLADTSRKHSFARMQSVQAFLDEHGDLRESPSFGDVSALVEQWMSLEDAHGDEDPEHLGLSSAFSF